MGVQSFTCLIVLEVESSTACYSLCRAQGLSSAVYVNYWCFVFLDLLTTARFRSTRARFIDNTADDNPCAYHGLTVSNVSRVLKLRAEYTNYFAIYDHLYSL